MDMLQNKPGGLNTSKIMTLEEAVNKFVFDGCSVSLGGNNGKNPMGVAYEIIRQGKKDLVIVDENSLTCEDMLIGAGCVKKVETSWMGISLMDMAYNLRRAMEHGVPRTIEVDDYTNYTGSLRLLAGAMNVPFMPTKSLLGSDIPKFNKNITIIEDPYGGGPVALVPAAKPDVTFIPVQRCDVKGNAQVWGPVGCDDLRAKAAIVTVIICEEIITTEEIERMPNMTTIPSYCVDAVVPQKFICHPWDCYGYYYWDLPFSMGYGEKASSYEGFREWLDEWVFGVKTHSEYCGKVGWERLMRLEAMAKKLNRIPV
jgi:glutaconate CoA-transferase subunit A